MPSVSVVIPIYNAEKSIERAIESIIGQSYTDFELILVDDGSKDASGSLCDEAAKKDSRIRVIHKENAGVSEARNDGAKAAVGKYVQFVDSDDYLPQDFLLRMMNAQKEYGDNAFVWCGLSIVSETKVKDERVWQYEEANISVTDKAALFRFSMKHLLNSPVNKLYHRDVIAKGNLKMRKDLQIAEDLLFNIEYLEKCAGDTKVVILNDLFYPYVQNGEVSLDNKYHPAYYEIHKEVLSKLWSVGQEFGVPKEDEDLFYQKYWEYMMVAMQNYDRKECDLSKKEKNRMLEKILKDPFFKECVRRKKGRMGRARYYAYLSGSSTIYHLLIRGK